MTRVTRRNFLRIGGLLGAAASLSACGAAGRTASRSSVPTELDLQATDLRLRRFMNRAGYGPTPELLSHAQTLGFAAYFEQQLYPERVTDTTAELFVRNLNMYQMDISQLELQDDEDVGIELVKSTFLRSLYSRRQLYEAMVEFWSDHFTIYVRKEEHLPKLKVIDDREVIRPHALGNFRDLLLASVKSPAMLYYLDNTSNYKNSPNENYARELMELHSLGIDGGYTQDDVQELARALTGWTMGIRGRNRGKWIFDEDVHDQGDKTILGHTFPAGEQSIYKIVDMLASHPSTAHFISYKLVRRFVSDQPSDALVARVAQSFTESNGDIKTTLRTLFNSDEFANAPLKLKRPYTLVVSALRGLGADIGLDGYEQIGIWLRQMGQVPFLWPMPDGFPDVASAWLGNLLPRWKFCGALVSGMEGVHIPYTKLAELGNIEEGRSAVVFAHQLLTGQEPSAERLNALADHVGNGDLTTPASREKLREAIALILASPEFQYA